jgi:hypothetical protein
MFVQYGYALGSFMLGLTWLFFILRRRDLLRVSTVGGLLGSVFGLSELLYRGEYWNPPTLFNFTARYGVGIEDIVFSFFCGALATILYDAIERKKLVRSSTPHHHRIFVYFFVITCILVLEFFLPKATIYNISISLLIGAIIIALIRSDLRKQIVVSAFLFTGLYVALFYIFLLSAPHYIDQVYTVSGVAATRIAGIPFGEFLFAFGVGAFWSGLFDYLYNYRIVSGKKP